jgi:hypothetical protein
MAVQTNTIEVESRFGVTVHHSLMTHDEGSDKLLIVLPGRGYTAEHPALYYLRKAAVQLGYDVLSVEYGFQAGRIDLTSENMPNLQNDVQAAVQTVLARGYGQICVAGKSLGTPLAVGLARTINDARVSLILLTPVAGATQMTGDLPTLAIIGTVDAAYSPELVQDEPHLTWHVYDGLNHSLEYKGDWRASLALLPEIIAACEAFLKAQSTPPS